MVCVKKKSIKRRRRRKKSAFLGDVCVGVRVVLSSGGATQRMRMRPCLAKDQAGKETDS